MSQGQVAPQGNGIAVAGLVLGLIGLLLAVATGWIPCVGLMLPLIPTVLAIIFGFVGGVVRSKVHRTAESLWRA